MSQPPPVATVTPTSFFQKWFTPSSSEEQQPAQPSSTDSGSRGTTSPSAPSIDLQSPMPHQRPNWAQPTSAFLYGNGSHNGTAESRTSSNYSKTVVVSKRSGSYQQLSATAPTEYLISSLNNQLGSGSVGESSDTRTRYYSTTTAPTEYLTSSLNNLGSGAVRESSRYSSTTTAPTEYLIGQSSQLGSGAVRASSATRYSSTTSYSSRSHAVTGCSSSATSSLHAAMAQQSLNGAPYCESWISNSGITYPVEHPSLLNMQASKAPPSHQYSIEITNSSGPTLSPAPSVRSSSSTTYHCSVPLSTIPMSSLSSSIITSCCATDRSEASTVAGDEQSTNGQESPSKSNEQESPSKRQHSTCRNRRMAVSAAPCRLEVVKNFKPPVYPKTEQEKKDIRKVISTNLSVLFGSVREQNKAKLVDAMLKVHVPKDTVLIKQGDPNGDHFFIVNEGKFDIFVKRSCGVEDKVWEAVPGMFFGEVALMYDAPRTATVVAAQDSVVWSLDRESFKSVLIKDEDDKKKRYEGFLEKIETFSRLNKYEISRLSDLLTVQECKDGDCIVRQGDMGDKFYILEQGELNCTLKHKDGSEDHISSLKPGHFFGELALMKSPEKHPTTPTSKFLASFDGRRQASVYSVGDSTLLWVDKPTFDRVFGPLQDFFRKKAMLYPKLPQKEYGDWTKGV